MSPIDIHASARAASDTEPGLLPLQHATSLTALAASNDQAPPAERLEDLASLVPGMFGEIRDGGLTSSVNLRGFNVTRHYYNGLPDVQQLFSRDLATVESVQILRGAAGVATGVNSPGGSVWYQGKLPHFSPAYAVSLAAGDQDWWRGGFDFNQPLSPTVAARVVAHAQDGETDPGQLSLQRNVALGALSWHYAPDGVLTVETERHLNRQPFLFGTVIVDGAVRYNQLYASPAQTAERESLRHALHWSHALTGALGTLRLRADAGRATVERNETLIGFFTIDTPTALVGYFTRYHDDYHQNNYRLEAIWQGKNGGIAHETQLGYEHAEQARVLVGVQNIGGFSVDVAQPDFSGVDPDALVQRPRYSATRSTEDGLYLRHQIQPARWLSFDAGVRRIRYQGFSTRNPGPLVRTTAGAGTVARLGVTLFPGSDFAPYLAYGEGLQPNSGLTSQGDFLPPQTSRQLELGAQWRWGALTSQIAAYQLELDKRPLTDPRDRNALVASGMLEVRGIEMSSDLRWGEGWRASSVFSHQRTRDIARAAAGLPSEFVGVPRLSATARLEKSLTRVAAFAPTRVWAQWQGQGRRPVDADNSVSLPGYALTSAGLSVEAGRTTLTASVQNLFDRDHVLSLTGFDDVYQGTRRRVFVGVRVDW